MSIINSTIMGAYGVGSIYGPGFGTVEDTPDPDAMPTLGETPAAQSIPYLIPRMSGPNSLGPGLADAIGGNYGGAGIPLSMGGACYNWSPGGLSLVPPVYGQYATYRMMADQPTMKATWKMIVDAVLASIPWTLEKTRDDAKDAWVDLAKKQVFSQLPMVLSAAVLSGQFGWQPFEKVWEVRDGYFWCNLQPMLQDYSTIYLNSGTGRFAGVSVTGPSTVLPPNKCWIATASPELGSPYGKSWYDAAYDPYVSWLQTRSDLKRLRAKLSGILPILFYPPGSTPINGKLVDNSVIATQILQTLGWGYGTAMPSVQFDPKDIARDPKLASTSLWRVEFYNAGTLTPAQDGMLNQLTYEDVLMSRALGMPERTGQAGKHGTNAESVTQSENSVTSKELFAASIAMQLSIGNPFIGVTGWIDDILRYNFGANAVGSIALKPPPFADTKLDYKAKIINQALSSTSPAGTAVVKAIQMNDALEDFGFKLEGDGFDVAEFSAATEKPEPVIVEPNAVPGNQQTMGKGDNVPVHLAASRNGNGRRTALDLFHDVLRLGNDA
jgi:hypothetical protein